jgi:mRNA interferase MazF
MAIYLQGDIVLVPFPFSDEPTETKARPAIIISNSTVNKTADVILAQITSTIRADEFSFLIDDKNVQTKLHNICEVRCHKLFTAQKSIIKKKISALKVDKYKDLKVIIDRVLEYQRP